MPTIPTTPGLALGTVKDGWKIIAVLDSAAGQYVVEPAGLSALTETVNTGLASSISEWASSRTYQKDHICIRNKSFFASAVNNNTGKDPSTDTSGGWGPFVPGETSSLYFNRAPTNADVYPVGVKWFDTSFGADTPLVMISMANGVWAYLNEIKLTKIRIYGRGIQATYRSNINGLAFFKDDGTQIPNSHFVWGAKGGFWGAAAGVAFASQTIEAGYNTSGWADIECGSQFDTSIKIGKITGNTPYFTMGNVEFWYSNGSKKIFTGAGGPTICTCDPPVICRYGDATAAAQGEMLTAAKLSDPNSNDYGRVSGAAFCSAVNALLAGLDARVKALEPPPAPKILSLAIQQGFPSADQATATLSPPEGKDFKFGGLFWMLNRIAPDNASISQGSGSTDSVNFAMPVEPGTYQLIINVEYLDSSSGEIRENFII